ncbi:MAG: ThuA domain-containing protein [Verrucomicrobiota bacterium]
MKPTMLGCLLCAGIATYSLTALAQAAPKRVLVVSTAMDYYHDVIPTGEKILAELAKTSGDFTVDFARVDPKSPQLKGSDGNPDKAKLEAAIRAVLAEKMSLAALRNVDAVVFANTSGSLPLPDRDGFLAWIKSGKGFVGMHAATDTLKDYPAYTDMIGALFLTHSPTQSTVPVVNQDSQNPACKHLPASWNVHEEFYIFDKFDRAKVHELLNIDQNPFDRKPMDYPVSWCKEYGNGRMFYTSLGHRDDIWDPKAAATNSKDVAEAYQKHILSAIRWAAGLEQWNLKPQGSNPKS